MEYIVTFAVVICTCGFSVAIVKRFKDKKVTTCLTCGKSKEEETK